jgi:hypothetical protein
MKTIFITAEIKLDDVTYNKVVSWGVEPSDYVVSILADHGRDRGLVIKMRGTETDYDIYKDVNHAVDTISKEKAVDDIEDALINNRLCISGNCGE